MAHDGRLADDHFVIAPFSISVQQPDGRWMIIEPKHTFRPNPWQQQLMLWLALSIVALIPLAYLFSRRLAAPIAVFAKAAERLGRDPHAEPLNLQGPAEIEVAVTAFNEMQERLARYVNDRTAMVGAIAHDLRTPLTRIRFRLEEAPEPIRAKMIADIAEMEAMISGTLAFVRDASKRADRSKLELSSLLESLADEMSETGLDVTVEHAERVVVEGDSIDLRRLFNNLLENAVKFGGGAKVGVSADHECAVVEIADKGPGIPDAELERVFEPFYRREASRSRDTGGIGLGLPVVRSIARAHGGDATLHNRPGGGLTARVSLPLGAV
jgi:signal transduction histidine kinase